MQPRPTPYEQLGGDAGVRRLVERFYSYMDELPEAADTRALHARNLKGSIEKLYLFLSGWLGGPDLYQQKYGHPMLRRRHLPFSIGNRERDQWLLCMQRALDEMPVDQTLRAQLMDAFVRTADHMRNRPEPGGHPWAARVPGSPRAAPPESERNDRRPQRRNPSRSQCGRDPEA